MYKYLCVYIYLYNEVIYLHKISSKLIFKKKKCDVRTGRQVSPNVTTCNTHKKKRKKTTKFA